LSGIFSELGAEEGAFVCDLVGVLVCDLVGAFVCDLDIEGAFVRELVGAALGAGLTVGTAEG